MKQLITIIIFTFLFQSHLISKNNFSTMSMNYEIVPNNKTNCVGNFVNGLTFFFEQVGGYGETAEVEQVSQIFNIDLSIFQDVEYNYDDKNDIKKHWHNIDNVVSIVDIFIQKISQNPEYYKKVHHNLINRNRQLDEERRLLQLTNEKERDKKLAELRKQPFYFYPPDYGYLSGGRLLKDLMILKQTLKCYKNDGVTKVRFEYS